jgi:sodium-dependent phosphate transporter
MVLTEYTYVFAIGTFFALLEAYNNGASTYHAMHATLLVVHMPISCLFLTD